jgi:hypothetical protein
MIYFFVKESFLKFKIDINDVQLFENDDQLSSSFYAYDSDVIKIQFLYNKIK